MHKETNHTKIIDHSKELNKIHGYRLGTITTIELTKNRIWVDFPDNPFNKAILAQLGTPWISSDELTVFRDKVDCVKLEFLDNNPAKPVIRDLFYSVNQLNRSGSKPFEDKVVEVEADRIILKGKKKSSSNAVRPEQSIRQRGRKLFTKQNRFNHRPKPSTGWRGEASFSIR